MCTTNCNLLLNDNFYGVSSDTIFIAIVTISIFAAGLLATRLYDYIKEYKRLSRLKKYYLFHLDHLLAPIQTRITHLRATARAISGGKVSTLFSFHDVALNVTSLKTIDHQDLYKIFVERKRKNIDRNIEYFWFISHSIDFFDSQRTPIENDLNQYIEKHNRDRIAFNDSMNAIFRLYDIYKSDNLINNIALSNDEFLWKIDRTIGAWIARDDGQDLHVTRNKLLAPLKSICKKHLRDPRSIQVLENVVKAILLSESLYSLRDIYSKHFKHHIKTLRMWYRKLKASIMYFSNKKYTS